jgi:hypothetical protein
MQQIQHHPLLYQTLQNPILFILYNSDLWVGVIGCYSVIPYTLVFTLPYNKNFFSILYFLFYFIYIR